MICNLLRGIAVVVLTSLAGFGVQVTYRHVKIPASQVKTIAAIGQDIANLKGQFPQLREFSLSQNVEPERLRITYEYHVHQSQSTAGWMAQVPEPDDDGVWFYIDFYNRRIATQIDTQPSPMFPPHCFEDKKLTYLLLEGEKNQSLYDAIWTILKQHGVKPCGTTHPNK